MCDHTQRERSSGTVRLPGLPPLTGRGQLEAVSCSITVHVKLGARGAGVGHLGEQVGHLGLLLHHMRFSQLLLLS